MLKDLRSEEAVNIAFGLLMSLLILSHASRIEHWGWKLMVNLAVIGMSIATSRIKASKGPLFHLRNWLFCIAVPVYFMNLRGVVGAVNPSRYDEALMALDRALFLGHYPELLIEHIYNPLLTEILQLAYVSYFIIPFILGIPLYLKDKRAFRQTATTLLLTYYLSYVGYFLVPAVGPRFTMKPMFKKALKGLALTQPIKRLLNSLEPTPLDCFPSGHTAVSLVCLAMAKRHRIAFKTLLPIVTGLIIATVYHRYHYVSDVLAGAALALFCLWAGPKLFELWERGR